jgi:hypothetical protein
MLEFDKKFEEVQKLWVKTCLETYGLFLDGLEKLVELGRQHHESIKKENK